MAEKKLDTATLKQIEQLAAIVQRSGIECIASSNAEANIWAKYNAPSDGTEISKSFTDAVY